MLICPPDPSPLLSSAAYDLPHTSHLALNRPSSVKTATAWQPVALAQPAPGQRRSHPLPVRPALPARSSARSSGARPLDRTRDLFLSCAALCTANVCLWEPRLCSRNPEARPHVMTRWHAGSGAFLPAACLSNLVVQSCRRFGDRGDQVSVSNRLGA